jgi:3-methyladenine DNA glycosylase AlkD
LRYRPIVQHRDGPDDALLRDHPGDALLTRLRAALRKIADPARAPAMQAYMKSSMPYHGVPTPALRALCKRVFADVELPSAAVWQRAVLTIWRDAEFREERYAAINLTGLRRADPFQTLDALPMYEEMIVSGAWWDYVDVLASHRVGLLLQRYPEPMRTTMLDWSVSDDLWKRRTSIICQLRFKANTDLDLLYACIEPSLASREFFLRKAIGWALRQHAWTDPAEVVRYVAAHQDRLSGLSQREALKNVPPDLQSEGRTSKGLRSEEIPPGELRPAGEIARPGTAG